MANQLSHIDANQLVMWKLLKPLDIRSMEDQGSFDATIKEIELPDPKSNQALHGTGTVQALSSTSRLSRFWENSPNEDYLHFIVQVPSVNTPESIKIDLVRGTADRLYRTLWKKPLNPILAPVVVPDPKKTYMYVPQDQLSKLGVKHLDCEEEALLFRDEYILAHKAIKEWSKKRRTEKSGGVVITGHPGLEMNAGKTCFLLYLLFHRLSKGLPTAFQFLPDSFVLFTNSGVKVYAHTFDELPDGTWALADCSAKDPLPCDSFLVACRSRDAFVVQTSSPDEKRYKTWRKEYKAYTYVMDCFPLTESVALGMIHGFNDQLIKDHCEKWGPSARIMMAHMTNPDRISRHTERVKQAAHHFVHNFGDYITDVNPTEVSHTLFTIHPKGLSSEDRQSSIGRIETSYLNRILMDKIAAKNQQEQINFYKLVSHHQWFKGSAGYILENVVLSRLCADPESKGLPCTPARSDLPQLTIPACQGHLNLSYEEQHSLEYLNRIRRPFCVIPTSKTSATVDATIFTDRHIITIQVTVASEHSVKETGFGQIANSFPKTFRQSREWCHVFVTDEAENAKSLVKNWTSDDLRIDLMDKGDPKGKQTQNDPKVKETESNPKGKQTENKPKVKDIEMFEEDETPEGHEVVGEAGNSDEVKMDED
ncbi:hypothetical protein B0F90DRAFT_1669030 [Multifurca ochricompacta]|uniref:Uncharacterized protein n=1 Tax=Multifurca ochricompacta TaxID=376703 RepID=A0AAD4QMD9_9AGAM|nr:hypothetical protein B0F90DRAFT_1669030 [Multifurca ochricompacta]